MKFYSHKSKDFEELLLAAYNLRGKAYDYQIQQAILFS